VRFVLASLVVLAAAPSCGGNVVVAAADAGQPGCKSDADCPAGETCDSAAGACSSGAPILCANDAECLAGLYCDTTTGMCKGTNEAASCRKCACIYPVSMGGCANVCEMGLNGTSTPNFCDGVPALAQCAKCLANLCGSLSPPPDPSNPAACM
jgi:Cys-rich repeat protein